MDSALPPSVERAKDLELSWRINEVKYSQAISRVSVKLKPNV
jgi:hypothetical protein